ncbi:MAG: hypothetical protein R3A45_01135 [Bdellovibrionota bacterium]
MKSYLKSLIISSIFFFVIGLFNTAMAQQTNNFNQVDVEEIFAGFLEEMSSLQTVHIIESEAHPDYSKGQKIIKNSFVQIGGQTLLGGGTEIEVDKEIEGINVIGAQNGIAVNKAHFDVQSEKLRDFFAVDSAASVKLKTLITQNLSTLVSGTSFIDVYFHVRNNRIYVHLNDIPSNSRKMVMVFLYDNAQEQFVETSPSNQIDANNLYKSIR